MLRNVYRAHSLLYKFVLTIGSVAGVTFNPFGYCEAGLRCVNLLTLVRLVAGNSLQPCSILQRLAVYLKFIFPLAVADIFKRQVQARIMVGDPHQQIYAFRGAVDAMRLVSATRIFYLTQVRMKSAHSTVIDFENWFRTCAILAFCILCSSAEIFFGWLYPS